MIKIAMLSSLSCLFAFAGVASPEVGAKPETVWGPALAPFVQTSAAGDRFKEQPAVSFVKGEATGVVVKIDPATLRQTIEGFGSALTESSAYVLANVSPSTRTRILDDFFGPGGARYTMARAHIGACDFCVKGKYSYDDTPGDMELKNFSIAVDKAGFADAKDPRYAVLPLIKDALAREPALKIVSSPWTAPAWMKDNKDWYGDGKGGVLLPANYDVFARYIAKYVEAYAAEGVKIWGVTPENEPLGNGGNWESMEFTAGTQRDYIRDHLGPQLAAHGLADVKIIQYDQNRGADAVAFSKAVFTDPVAAKYVWGTGLHWYGTTISADTDTMDAIHLLAPEKPVLHTEGCVDAIGLAVDSPQGKFRGWKNDPYWWTEGTADWGWYFASRTEHPLYAPVHRYARDIIDGLNHWFVGWIDWNIVLDRRGGPNHVNNLAAAPIMIDTAAEDVYITPVFYVMAHFSRYLRPGDHVVQVTTSAPGVRADDLHVTAAVSADKTSLTVVAFSKAKEAVTYHLQVGGRYAAVTIPANAIQTLRFNLAELK